MTHDQLAPVTQSGLNTTSLPRNQMPATASTIPQVPLVRLGRRMTAHAVPSWLRGPTTLLKKLVWTGYEARLLTTPGRYAMRELLHPTTAQYTLRGGGKIVLRHQTGDIDIFRKFYAYGYYDWPAEVCAQLRAIGRPINVLDLGANIGFFEVHAAEAFALGRVVGFEPDPSNLRILDQTRRANDADWIIVPACAAKVDGIVRFSSGRQNFSRIAADGDFEVPTRDAFPFIASADLVKMNIEGSEWEILDDPRMAEVTAVWMIEYHRIRNPEDDITGLAQRLLERHGYTTRLAMTDAGDTAENNGLIWAWREIPPTA